MANIINLSNTSFANYPGLVFVLEKILYLPTINHLCKQAPKTTDLTVLIDYIVQALGIKIKFQSEDLTTFPQEGPVIVVANHPFGGLEGIIMAQLLLHLRYDVKIMANYLLKIITPISPLFIGVDPFESKAIKNKNVLGIRAAHKWLAKGGVLGVFPSGTVSHWQYKYGQIIDPEWHNSIARLAELTQATVIPCYFHGQNSWYFHLAGFISKYLRTLLLPQQLFSKKDKSIEVTMGNPILFSELEKLKTSQTKMQYLRHRTYLLKYRASDHVKNNISTFYTSLSNHQSNKSMLQEINLLPQSACLVDQDRYAVYIAKATSIPHILQEIGLLREMNFRLVNEGTGKSTDLDCFDPYYWHLFSWDKIQHKIMGAYRLGLTDEILPVYGDAGLYVSQIYRLSNEFFSRVTPAIELGRSFVAEEYQKKPLSLFLLWKAIVRFILQNPRYISLYGLVSISQHYKKNESGFNNVISCKTLF